MGSHQQPDAHPRPTSTAPSQRALQQPPMAGALAQARLSPARTALTQAAAEGIAI